MDSKVGISKFTGWFSAISLRSQPLVLEERGARDPFYFPLRRGQETGRMCYCNTDRQTRLLHGPRSHGQELKYASRLKCRSA